jgi:hypothetical protein
VIEHLPKHVCRPRFKHYSTAKNRKGKNSVIVTWINRTAFRNKFKHLLPTHISILKLYYLGQVWWLPVIPATKEAETR